MGPSCEDAATPGPQLTLFLGTMKNLHYVEFALSEKDPSQTNWLSQCDSLSKEIEIVHRLSLVRIAYCVGTCRVKQKRKQTKVFTNHVGGFVESYSSSCSR